MSDRSSIPAGQCTSIASFDALRAAVEEQRVLLHDISRYQSNEQCVWRGLQTLFMSVSVGAACSAYAPFIVLEAVVLTAAIVGALTAYRYPL